MRTTHTTRRFAALIAAIVTTTLTTGHAQNSDVRAMFDEAVHWQEVKGDLPKAMTLYRAIVERYSTDAVAPKALLELAGCYEKLGSPEAVGIYQQIVIQYASSTSATRARAKLAEQGASSSTARRLWTEGVTGRVSPDGKYIATSDAASGDLLTRETATGRIRRLTSNTVRADGPYVFSEPIPSPDSQSIAYSWFQPDSKRYELRVISRDGGAPRTLYASMEESNNRPVGWFPDGKSLLMSVSSGTAQKITTRLLRITLTAGQPAPVNGFSPENAGGVQLSPDGQFVVFDQAAAGTGQERDIFVHSIAAIRGQDG